MKEKVSVLMSIYFKEKPEYFRESLESIKNQIISQKTGNTYNDVKMVHDYLINTIEYETTISKNNIYNIYGALVQNESVCEGYAKAFKYLLDELQIPCVMVIGEATNSKGETENQRMDCTLFSLWSCKYPDVCSLSGSCSSYVAICLRFCCEPAGGGFVGEGRIFDGH